MACWLTVSSRSREFAMPPQNTMPSSSALPPSGSSAASSAVNPLFTQPASVPSSLLSSPDLPELAQFLQKDADMPQQPPTLVQTVTQSLQPAQAMEASLQRSRRIATQDIGTASMDKRHVAEQAATPATPVHAYCGGSPACS